MEGLCEHLEIYQRHHSMETRSEQEKPSLPSCAQCCPPGSLTPLTSVLTVCEGVSVTLVDTDFPVV